MARVQTSLRIEEQALAEAKVILNSLGMNFTDAVNIFTHMIVQAKGLPFEIKIPNHKTAQVIEEARKGVHVDELSIDELK